MVGQLFDGSLYKVRLRVTDHAGLVTVAESEKPFSIVRPNNESVRTFELAPELLSVSERSQAPQVRPKEALPEPDR